MGHRLTPEQERQALRDATREAHETLQALYQAIREARALTPDLVAGFEATHTREMQLLSNHLTAESNRVSAQLNDTIHSCREMIVKQIMAGEAVLDTRTRTVTIKFGTMAFDDQQPPPYPDTTTKENHQ
jgi:hypothetical protein